MNRGVDMFYGLYCGIANAARQDRFLTDNRFIVCCYDAGLHEMIRSVY
jgi:hypothetical protein